MSKFQVTAEALNWVLEINNPALSTDVETKTKRNTLINKRASEQSQKSQSTSQSDGSDYMQEIQNPNSF